MNRINNLLNNSDNSIFKSGIQNDTIKEEGWGEVVVDGAGNSPALRGKTRNYKTQDANPYYGVSYYRLKQTDFDGKFTHSNVAINITRIYNFSVNRQSGSLI